MQRHVEEVLANQQIVINDCDIRRVSQQCTKELLIVAHIHSVCENVQ